MGLFPGKYARGQINDRTLKNDLFNYKKNEKNKTTINVDIHSRNAYQINFSNKILPVNYAPIISGGCSGEMWGEESNF